MLLIETLPVGQLSANCYIVYSKTTSEAVIVDPGDDAEYIHNKLTHLGVTPTAIAVTHAHYDHLMAVMELRLAYGIPFVLHRNDTPLLVHYRKSAMHFSQIDPGPAPKPDAFYKEGERIPVGKEYLEVIETPGHTPGGVSLYSKHSNFCLTGDTIFADGAIGRWDFPYCSKADLLESVQKVLLLPEDTVLYPGHGEPTLVSRERLYHLT